MFLDVQHQDRRTQDRDQYQNLKTKSDDVNQRTKNNHITRVTNNSLFFL